MIISVKTYDNKLVNIFDTSKDKKKEIVLTTIISNQKKAEANLYFDNKFAKTIYFNNIPHGNPSNINLSIVITYKNNKLIFDHNENKSITIEKSNEGKKILLFSSVLIIAILFIFLSILFVSKNFGIKSKNRKEKYTNKVDKIKEISNDKDSNQIDRSEISEDIAKEKSIDESYGIDNLNSSELEVESREAQYTFEDLKQIIIENTPIHFIENEAILLENEKRKLNKIIKFINNYSYLKVEIHGHTESINKPENEMWLSKKRATYIKEIIEEKTYNTKIDFLIRGHGSLESLKKDASIKEQYLNRRVEIELISTSAE